MEEKIGAGITGPELLENLKKDNKTGTMILQEIQIDPKKILSEKDIEFCGGFKKMAECADFTIKDLGKMMKVVNDQFIENKIFYRNRADHILAVIEGAIKLQDQCIDKASSNEEDNS